MRDILRIMRAAHGGHRGKSCCPIAKKNLRMTMTVKAKTMQLSRPRRSARWYVHADASTYRPGAWRPHRPKDGQGQNCSTVRVGCCVRSLPDTQPLRRTVLRSGSHPAMYRRGNVWGTSFSLIPAKPKSLSRCPTRRDYSLWPTPPSRWALQRGSSRTRTSHTLIIQGPYAGGARQSHRDRPRPRAHFGHGPAYASIQITVGELPFLHINA